MDGRERIAEPLTSRARWRARLPTLGRAVKRARVRRNDNADRPPSRLARVLRRSTRTILKARPPRGLGTAAAAVVVLASPGYGMVPGDPVAPVVDALKGTRGS